MRLVIDNVSTQAVSGGVDNLLEFDVMQKLREYLRVRPDGYEHADAYKKHGWDGFQYFINSKGVFATGFVPMVASYLSELGVQITVEDKRGYLPTLRPEEDFDEFVGNIRNKHGILEEWWGRDYQVKIAKRLTNYIIINGTEYYFPRGIFDAATNAGKNSIAALVMRNLVNPNDEVIFMVSGVTIYKQAVAFFSDVIGEPVGQINDKKYDVKRVTVAMQKSLYNKAMKSVNVRLMLAKTKVLIVDESDEAGAKDYSRLLAMCGAGMRLFISGTPLDSTRVNNMIAVGLSGQVIGSISNDYLIKHGWSQRPRVRILLNNTPSFLLNYPAELEKTIHYSENRIAVISQEVISVHREPTLITFFEKEHGYFMLEKLRLWHPDLIIEIVHGTSPERAKIIEDYDNGKIDVLLTSIILKRGANISVIRILVNAAGGKSKTTVKQFTGRALRHDGKNDEVLVFDMYDVGKYVGDHSRRRIKIYEGEGFEVTKNYADHRGKPVL